MNVQGLSLGLFDRSGAMAANIYPDKKPLKRFECHRMPRPCPFVSCRYHLYLHLSRNKQRIYINPLVRDEENIEKALRALPHTCALDAADLATLTRNRHLTLEYIGACLGLTRERIRQIEHKAIERLSVIILDEYEEWGDLDPKEDE
jgi:hypothetical protein